MAAVPPGPFTIVGHSAGAIVGLAIAAGAPERVTAFVAVAGVVPSTPGSFISAMPAPNRWVLSAVMRVAGTRPPEKAIRTSLAEGLDGDTTDRIVEEFVPESQQLFRTPISSTYTPTRRGYVRTSRDRELPVQLQQRFVGALSPDWTTTLDTGHLPMLEDPPALARAITDFAAAPPTFD